MRKIAFFFLLFTSSVVLVFCTGFQDLTFEGVEQVNILSLTKDGVEAEISAKITNPNHLSFTIYKSDMDISLNGIDLGKATFGENIHLKRNSTEVYKLKVKSDFSKLNFFDLPKIFSLALSKKLNIGVKGNLKVGKGFIKKNVPVNIVNEVPIGGM